MRRGKLSRGHQLSPNGRRGSFRGSFAGSFPKGQAHPMSITLQKQPNLSPEGYKLDVRQSERSDLHNEQESSRCQFSFSGNCYFFLFCLCAGIGDKSDSLDCRSWRADGRHHCHFIGTSPRCQGEVSCRVTGWAWNYSYMVRDNFWLVIHTKFDANSQLIAFWGIAWRPTVGEHAQTAEFVCPQYLRRCAAGRSAGVAPCAANEISKRAARTPKCAIQTEVSASTSLIWREA